MAKGKKGVALLQQVHEDVRALNAAVSVMAQKIRHITRNEKILGRNLIVLNKKLQALKEAQAESRGVPEDLQARLEKLEALAQENKRRLDDVVATANQSLISEAELKELKYVVDAINPLEYVTLQQVKDLLDRRLGKQRPAPSSPSAR